MSTFVIVKERAGSWRTIAFSNGSTYHHDVVEIILAICKFQVRKDPDTSTQIFVSPFRALACLFLPMHSLVDCAFHCFAGASKVEKTPIGVAVAKMETSLTLVQSLIPLIVLLLCLALYIVRHYVSPGTSWFIQFLVTVAFTFGFFGLALMPIDLSLTTSIDSR